MGIVKRAGDLVYTFRFLKLLTTAFEDTEAYKLGIIDQKGNRIKSFDLGDMYNRQNYKEYYTPFHRLVFNIKKLMSKVPGGGSSLASYAAALYLIKEKFSISDSKIEKALMEAGVDILDFMIEQSTWFVLEDGRLSPGSYMIKHEKVLNSSMDEVVKPNDLVRVDENCYPVGEIFGLSVYEATHSKTKQKVYVTIGELAR